MRQLAKEREELEKENERLRSELRQKIEEFRKRQDKLSALIRKLERESPRWDAVHDE